MNFASIEQLLMQWIFNFNF